MKKIFAIIFCLLWASMSYSIIYEYVDESGRSFFYRKTRVPMLGEPREKADTPDEIKFVGGQGFSCFVESNDPNYNKEEMIKELKLIYRDSVLVLYNKNKKFMERNFPEHTYTFFEVYKFAVSVANGMIWLGYDCECHINMSFCVGDIIQFKIEEVKKHPYILGYLYREEKYYDGKKCKLKQLSGIKIN